MELTIRDCGPCTKHLQPGIEFDVTLDFSDGEEGYDRIPVNVGGRVEAKDGTILGQLHDWSRKGPDSNPMKLHAGNSGQDRRDMQYLSTLYSPIGEEGIEYLEEIREETRKDDIILSVIVETRVLQSHSNISSMHRVSFSDTELDEPEQIEGYPKTGLVTFGYDNEIQPGHSGLWVLSGDGGAGFLSVGRQTDCKTKFRIPSRDWTDDFLPELGFGQNLIINIPHSKNFDNKEISESLQTSYEELEVIKSELQRGEWRSVVSHTLGLYDAIDDSELWELQDSGYTEEAEGCLTALNSNFSDFLGKFRHRRGRGGELQEKTEPHREDAYFMYAMMAGLIQLLVEKHLSTTS